MPVDGTAHVEGVGEMQQQSDRDRECAETSPHEGLQRQAATAWLLAVLALAMGLLLPQPLRKCWATIVVVVWAATGLLFGYATVRRVAGRVHLDNERDRISKYRAQARGAWRNLWHRVRRLPDGVMQQPLTWPFVVAAGLIAALTGFEALSLRVGAGLLTWVLLASSLLYLLTVFVDAVETMMKYVSISGLLFSVCVWTATTTLVVLSVNDFHLPKPEPGFFTTAAQIDAALLVAAGLTVAAPPAWATSPQMHFAWIATGPLMATLGLAASIAGAISRQPSVLLFVLSVSPVLPILWALMLGAYFRMHDGYKSGRTPHWGEMYSARIDARRALVESLPRPPEHPRWRARTALRR